MKTQLQLTIFIVHIGLIFVHSHNRNGYQSWKEALQIGVLESQNIFNNMKDELQRVQNTNIHRKNFFTDEKWITKREINNPVRFGSTLVQPRNQVANQIFKITDNEIHSKILKQDEAKEAQVFDAMKEELRNIHKKRDFYNKNNVFTLVKRETNETFDPNKKPYMFPDIKDEDVKEAVRKLLLSQRTYQKEIDRLFRVMCKKNWNHPESDHLNRSIDRILATADQTINSVIAVIEEHQKNGILSHLFNREPLGYQAARQLMDNWKYIHDFINRYLNQFDLDVKEESDAMQKPLELAITEMEAYHKYLDYLYHYSGIGHMEDRNEHSFEFKYQKYGMGSKNQTMKLE